MKIVLKSARITDPKSPYHATTQDVFIENGVIQKIAPSIEEKDALNLSFPNLHISQGWVDFKSNFFDPGFEYRETLTNGLDTAALGGFTHIGALSSESPIADKKSAIEYKIRHAESHAVTLHPIGAITKKQEGKELAELFDMFNSGSRWFSDDLETLNEGMLYRASLYIKDFNGKLIFFPRSKNVSNDGFVNDGEASVFTGLKGDIAMGESIEINKAIAISKYTSCPIHITGISCKDSVEIIGQAKKEGINITADVNVMNLCFNETSVLDFDTQFKVLPVLRSEEDRLALIGGLENRILDGIVSDHRPMHEDEKEIEFDQANFGSTQLQTMFSALNTFSGLDTDQVVEMLSIRNRETFEIPFHPIAEGGMADITLYNPDSLWKVEPKELLSFNKTNPFTHKELKGQVYGIINGNQSILKEN